jgi:branched-subunit amino acid aminotransferase/4-amino-4-deoxychorismate lyase
MSMMINGQLSNPDAFDWLNDSGFRYGYGCFETMRFLNGTVPLFDRHHHRLMASLAQYSIAYDSQGLLDRVIDFMALAHPDGGSAVVNVHVTGGCLAPSPGAVPTATEIISTAAMPMPCSPMWERCFIEPSEFIPCKSMAYASHIHALVTAKHWPIYVDSNQQVVDSSIFAIGCIYNNIIHFAAHERQLPSVSRQVILETFHEAVYAPLTFKEWSQADAQFGCNAVRGIVPLVGLNQAVVKHERYARMNRCLGVFDAGYLG